jgi:uncharacterized protein YndB with AHSA1/START domain
MSSVVHDSFSIERTYPAPPERVFAAWATREAKLQWFGADEGLEQHGAYELEFRPGGREHFSAKFEGSVYDFDATYYDIVDNERIVWAYDMHVDGRRMSVSIGTVQISGVPGGTQLVMTEQGAFLDGLDTNEQRRGGTEAFLDELGRYLTANG